MAHVDTIYEISFNGHPVAEMDIRLTVDPTNSTHPVDVLAAEIGTYRSGTRYVAVPEPMRTEIIDWAWTKKRDELDEAFSAFVTGSYAYDREIARAAE